MSSQQAPTVKSTQDENVLVETSAKMEQVKQSAKPNIHALLLNRNKKPLAAKNSDSQVPSTPSNIKRLQVNKWFNSPTDNMFSPITKKLYKKSQLPIKGCDLTEELSDPDESNLTENKTQN